MKFRIILLGIGIFMASNIEAIADTTKLDYPKGYRNWAHVKSLIIEPGHPLENPFEGIHHIYGNKKALEGYRKGNFPEGSIIVFDLLKLKKGEHAQGESERKLIGVMVRDQSLYSKTGGWGFEAFGGDSKDKRLVADQGQSCFACHASQKESQFVFSKWRK